METTESTTTVSYLDLLADIDGILTFKLFDKRDYFNFLIVNLPHLDSNKPVKPAYGAYVSQLIRYFSACTYYSDVLYTQQLLTTEISITRIPQKVLKHSFFSYFVVIMLRIHIILHIILCSRKEYIIIV